VTPLRGGARILGCPQTAFHVGKASRQAAGSRCGVKEARYGDRSVCSTHWQQPAPGCLHGVALGPHRSSHSSRRGRTVPRCRQPAARCQKPSRFEDSDGLKVELTLKMLLIDHLFGNRPLHHPMDQASQLFPSFVHLNGTSTVVEIPKLTQKKISSRGGPRKTTFILIPNVASALKLQLEAAGLKL